MTRKDELALCKVCGHKELEIIENEKGYFYVVCHYCFRNNCAYKTKEEAIEAWNLSNKMQKHPN